MSYVEKERKLAEATEAIRRERYRECWKLARVLESLRSGIRAAFPRTPLHPAWLDAHGEFSVMRSGFGVTIRTPEGEFVRDVATAELRHEVLEILLGRVPSHQHRWSPPTSSETLLWEASDADRANVFSRFAALMLAAGEPPEIPPARD